MHRLPSIAVWTAFSLLAGVGPRESETPTMRGPIEPAVARPSDFGSLDSEPPVWDDPAPIQVAEMLREGVEPGGPQLPERRMRVLLGFSTKRGLYLLVDFTRRTGVQIWLWPFRPPSFALLPPRR